MKDTKKYFNDKTVTSLLYVLAVIVVISVIIVTIAAFTSQNRAKKTVTTTTSGAVNTQITTSQNATTTQKPETTTKPGTTTTNPKPGDKDPSTDVSNDPVELILPVDGVINKNYDIENLSYSMTMNDYRTHKGVDITADEGSEVKAAEDGKVSAIYEDYLMGQCIEIDHGHGIVTIYKNLSTEIPEGLAEGSEVKCGQIIGAVGSSAIIEQADEAHLHFELEMDGEPVNPLDYIDYTEETLAPSYEDE